ncbi:MAG: DMT family transporter [Flavobacterium sp.]
MFKTEVFKGAFLIGLGAAGYGMLATIVKLAYDDHFTTAEISTAQFIYGIVGMFLIHYFQKKRSQNTVVKTSKLNIFKLIFAGTSLGLTSVFYYLSLNYVSVSVGIVLLMQTVWMSIVLEMFLNKKLPSILKLVSIFIVLTGTVLATNLLESEIILDWRGVFFGLLAAASFSTTMYASNRIAIASLASERTLYMLLGGLLAVLVFACFLQIGFFNFEIFAKWGILLALFGTILPPLLMNAGFPYTGIGLGSIVSSLELPVSVLMAYFILDEKVILSQWIGIGLIIIAIGIVNIKSLKNR